MEVTVKLNNIRTSPRKIRPILPIIRGKMASNALDILKFTNKTCAKDLYQLVKSGVAAAVEHEMNADQLFIMSVKCDQAQILKRHIFKARGRTSRIHKRSSHLTLVISDTYSTVNDQTTKEETLDIKKSENKKDKNKIIKKSPINK